MTWTKDQMAAIAAREIRDGDRAELGSGTATLVARHVPPGVRVTFQPEDGSGRRADIAILDAQQVGANGDLADQAVPGATPLVAGDRKVVVVTDRVADDGAPKILEECTLPLTGSGVVDRIVTDRAVFDVTDLGLVLRAVAPDVDLKSLAELTGAEFIIVPGE